MPTDRPPLSPAVFLDRDGTLMEDVHYCNDPADVHVFEGVSDGLTALRQAGFRVIIATNQSGIGRGIITQEQYEAVNAEFLRQTGPELIDAVYYAPDSPDQPSPRRKPEPGMFLEAAEEHSLDLAKSWSIGDKSRDLKAGKRVGTRSILVRTGYGAEEEEEGAKADFIVDTFAHAAQLILSKQNLFSRDTVHRDSGCDI